MASYSGLDCGSSAVSSIRATRGEPLPSGSIVTVGRRPRASLPSTRFSSAQPRPMYCSRPSGSTAPVPRESSRNTSIASGPTANVHGWVLCGLAASTAHGHRAERARGVLPVRPWLVGRTAAGIEHRAVVDPVAQQAGTGDGDGGPADADRPKHLAA